MSSISRRKRNVVGTLLLTTSISQTVSLNLVSGNIAEKQERGNYHSVAADVVHESDDSGAEDADQASDISYTDSESSGKSPAFTLSSS